MSYFDSAFIAKFYLDEPESEAIRALAASLGRVHCVSYGRLEVAAALHRKLREGTFTEPVLREVSGQFSDDCNAGLWTWLPITDELIAAVAQSITRLPGTVFLRAADALHLACAREHGFAEIYTSDRHVLAAAHHYKLKAVSDPRVR